MPLVSLLVFATGLGTQTHSAGSAAWFRARDFVFTGTSARIDGGWDLLSACYLIACVRWVETDQRAVVFHAVARGC
jgi:hypothetical protein